MIGRIGPGCGGIMSEHAQTLLDPTVSLVSYNLTPMVTEADLCFQFYID